MPSKPYRAACHLFDWSICIWVSGIGSALIKVTTRAWIKATIAIISLKVIGISQTLISTVPNPGWGLTSHQRSLTEFIIPAFSSCSVKFSKWFHLFK